jgi:hypothetical protein
MKQMVLELIDNFPNEISNEIDDEVIMWIK